MIQRKLTDEDILSLPKLYLSGLSSWAIAKRFSTDHSNILCHLKRLEISRRDRSSAAKQGVISGRILIRKNKIPKNLSLNKDFAYILGVLAGDGFIDYNNSRRTYSLGLSAADKEFVEMFKHSLFNFFKLRSSVEFKRSRNPRWNDQYITRLSSKEACDFVYSFGEFRKENWRVPNWIFNSTNWIKSAFVKGFFDSEGEIDKKIGRIGATSMNLFGLQEIGLLLKGVGIRYTIIKKKDVRSNTNQKYLLRIHDKKSIILFNNLVGFTIKRKQIILDSFIKKWVLKD